MPNYLLSIAYDGTAYAGWQRQAGVDTVQERVEAACERIFGAHLTVEGAGRTDAGVHALEMIANVRLPRPFAGANLTLALNGNLPFDISVRAAALVADDFHARFSAIGKRYLYRMVMGRQRPAIARSYFHWVRRPIDVEAMRTAAQFLLGCHDFQSFATNPGYERKHGTVRTIQHLHLWRRPWGLDLVVQGDGFLYNMVRTLAGTLLDVGTGRRQPAWVREVLAARNRSAAGATAPASGLYLVRVLYPRDVATLPHWSRRQMPFQSR